MAEPSSYLHALYAQLGVEIPATPMLCFRFKDRPIGSNCFEASGPEIPLAELGNYGWCHLEDGWMLELARHEGTYCWNHGAAAPYFPSSEPFTWFGNSTLEAVVRPVVLPDWLRSLPAKPIEHTIWRRHVTQAVP